MNCDKIIHLTEMKPKFISSSGLIATAPRAWRGERDRASVAGPGLLVRGGAARPAAAGADQRPPGPVPGAQEQPREHSGGQASVIN